jgi:hypothetical protein
MIKYEIIKAKANFIENKVEITNLPTLLGTEKQIAWAEKLRQENLANIIKLYNERIKVDVRSYYKNDLEKIQQMDLEFETFFQDKAEKTDSKYWIENRYDSINYTDMLNMFRHIFK